MTRSFNDALTGNFVGPDEKPPVEMLGELAASLSRKLKYKINFEVSSSTMNGRAIHTVRAVVERIDYILDLLTVSHEVLQLYPAKVSGLLCTATDVHSEGELFDKLVESFNSKKAGETLGTLLKQA